MITAKGILYTVAGAAIAGVVVGNLLTSKQGQGIGARLKKSAQDWLSQQRNKNRLVHSHESAHQRAEFDQAHSSGPAS